MSNNKFLYTTLQAVDLSPDGVNLIDLDVGQTGANDQQNFPLITSASGSDVQGEVRLELASANGTYKIELYVSQQCVNASGFSSAAQRLGSVSGIVLNCATPTSNCVKPMVIPVDNSVIGDYGMLGNFITAIAIDEENNTSEVSACVAYALGDNIFKKCFE